MQFIIYARLLVA